jgi:beta-lactamase superfamily II metal-dependent hydrolase
MRKIALTIGILLIPLGAALADIVVTRDTVKNFVNIRQLADGDSDSIGKLRPGDRVPHVRSVTGWHVIEMPGGSDGFVPKRWTEVLPDPVDLSQNVVVHFLDVGTGDSAIIDMADREIVIDGGDSIAVLNRYARRTDLIQDPIELVVVTHGDTDHWKGLTRLVGFDGTEDDPFSVSEYWDRGYNRDCNAATQGGRVNYLKFVENMDNAIPAARFHRPLADSHPPVSAGATPQALTLDSLPGVEITVLHTDENPTEGSCSYKINNASIVLMIDIEGFRFLFTGDANGKERAEPSPVTPGHVEAKLLDLEAAHTGLLSADVLKVPHHGSETASTQQFIDIVDPDFAIISASTKHHLPKSTVVARYDDGQRVILRTDNNHENDTDHILCVISSVSDTENELDCNFEDVFNQ